MSKERSGKQFCVAKILGENSMISRIIGSYLIQVNPEPESECERRVNRLCVLHGKTLPPAQICYGDSGGPLILEENGKSIVIGVASSFYGCTTNRKAYFTNVQKFRGFISASTGLLRETEAEHDGQLTNTSYGSLNLGNITNQHKMYMITV